MPLNMSDLILVTMFSAVPFGLILARVLYLSIMSRDEQIEKYNMDGLIMIEGRN